MKAIWKDKVIAESDDTVMVEGNHYFPQDSVNMEYLSSTDTTSTCPWKGEASYYSIKVGSEVNEDAGWTYKEPKEKAQNIRGYIAFWKGVEIVN